MKKTIAILVLSTLGFQFVSAQIIAGDVPSGMTSINPNIHLSIATSFTEDTAYLDIDCDSVNDILIRLGKVAASVDLPNFVTFYVLDTSSLQLCGDTGSFDHPQITFYNAFDTLSCTGDAYWATDTQFYGGNYGCNGCPGPFSHSNVFIAYAKQISPGFFIPGWVKLSFVLDEPADGPVTLTVHEILQTCGPTSVPALNADAIQVIPNPTADGRIQIKSEQNILQTEIINALGQTVAVLNGNQTDITLPEAKGIYLIRIQSERGYAIGKAYRE